MAWATTAEVLTYTGHTVVDSDVEVAQFMVELFTDVTEDSVIESPRNLRMLKMAVAYQAAWVSEKPDLFTHTDLGNILEDQLQAVFSHENANLLAPMARRAINRLSWKRNRSIKVKPSKRTGRGNRRISYQGVDTVQNEGQWGEL